MKKSIVRIISLVLVVFVTGVLLLSTTYFIPRHGNQLTYLEDGPTHRDVRGVPFVFLKRSVGDGQCDAVDLNKGTCSTDLGNEPHEVLLPYLVLDAVFWLSVTAIPLVVLIKPKKR